MGYNLAIRLISNNGFVQAKDFPMFGTMWNKCSSIHTLCKLNDMTPFKYFLLANTKYDQAWKKKTFKTVYIPLSVAVSSKVSGWVFENWRQAWQSLAETNRSALYKEMLSTYSQEVQEAVIAKIEEGV